ncbi:MAG: hypothetical protein NVSMB1_25800 [Polyangiales bacterium]
MEGLQGPSALRAWITKIAVFTARGCIRRRSRRRWLKFSDDPPEVADTPANPEANEALRTTYAVLERLPTDERIALALRVIEGMELTEVATACGVSLATIKRRLKSAETRFLSAARQHPILQECLEGGHRWSKP